MNIILERIDKLLNENGQKRANLIKEIGIPSSTYSTWVQKDRMPDSKYLLAIAQYLGTTTDYLLGLDEGYYISPETIELANELKDNPGQKVLLDASKNLSHSDLFEVLDFINKQNKKEGR